MITLDDIFLNSKTHPYGMGKQTIFYNDFLKVSIVGGSASVYGDFEKNFEVAILDTKKNEFVTKFYFSETSDDIVPYLDSEKLILFLNRIFKKGYQVY